jgi:hypothetical protein
MGQRADNPWLVDEVDDALVARLAGDHAPNPRALELDVDIMSDPHREDDDGHNWTRLNEARNVRDVVPGSAVVMGSSIGCYLARVLAWDFEVSDEDPIVVLEILPVRPSEVGRLLGRHRTPAA